MNTPNPKKFLTIAPQTERPDPPSLKAVRKAVQRQSRERHLAAMRQGPTLVPYNRSVDLSLDSLGAMRRTDGWNPRVLEEF